MLGDDTNQKLKKQPKQQVFYKGSRRISCKGSGEKDIVTRQHVKKDVVNLAQASPPEVQDTITELEKLLKVSPDPKTDQSQQKSGCDSSQSASSTQLSEAKTRVQGSQDSIGGSNTADMGIRKGDTVRLLHGNGSLSDVHVVAVDVSVRPPTYLIRTNKGQEQTVERSRLQVPAQQRDVPEVVELEHLLKDMRRRRSTGASLGDRPRRQKLEVMVVSARHVPPLSGAIAERDSRMSLQGAVPGMVYVRLKYLGKARESTKRWDDRHPRWEERFPLGLHSDDGDPDEDEDMEVKVMEHYEVEGVRDRVLGQCVVSGAEMQAAPQEGEGEPKSITLVLFDSKGRKVVNADNKTATITLSLRRREVPPGCVSRASLRSSGAGCLQK